MLECLKEHHRNDRDSYQMYIRYRQGNHLFLLLGVAHQGFGKEKPCKDKDSQDRMSEQAMGEYGLGLGCIILLDRFGGKGSNHSGETDAKGHQ